LAHGAHGASGRGRRGGRADRDLAPEAFRLARLLDHPVYDCLYLALAMESGAPVVTADRRFAAAAARDAASAPLVVALSAL